MLGFVNKKHDLKGHLSDLVQLWPNHTVPQIQIECYEHSLSNVM